MQIVRCNKCGWIGDEDFLDGSHPEEGFWCPNCDGKDAYLQDLNYGDSFSLKEAKPLWELLGYIPVDDYGNIQEEFLGFEIGTNREDIWHWFEDTFHLSVGDDLMGMED